MAHGSPSYKIRSDELRRRRENAGLTQRGLAAKCREAGRPIDTSQIASYELGRHNPRPRTLRAIADALDCDPDDLVVREAVA